MDKLRIISGMQTGADIAGVKFAKEFGYEYGGLMPKKYLTEMGYRPGYNRLYNATESSSASYTVRTEENVKSSDLTIIFDFADSIGSKQTKRYCRKWNKSYVYFTTESDISIIKELKSVFKGFPFKTINIAGNRESKSPGIEKRVYNILKQVFDV